MNVLGTYNLLASSYEYWSKLSNVKKNRFKFIHISNDEAYGSLKGKIQSLKKVTDITKQSLFCF